MPYLTLGQASKETGKSKATILNAIRKGKFSANKDDVTGQWQIDPARLFQVYDPVSLNSSTNSETERGQTPKNDNVNSVLQLELKLKDEYHEKREKELQAQIEDLKKERDRLLGVVEKAQENVRLLTYQQEQPAQQPQTGFFQRLFGRGA